MPRTDTMQQVCCWTHPQTTVDRLVYQDVCTWRNMEEMLPSLKEDLHSNST